MSDQQITQPATRVTLPATPEVRKWVETTQAQRAALQARADRVREKFEPLRKELAGIERSIKVMDHFLAQVDVDEPPAGASVRSPRSVRPGGLLQSGKWSRKQDACLGCGTSERPHKAKDLCGRCYDNAAKADALVEAAS